MQEVHKPPSSAAATSSSAEGDAPESIDLQWLLTGKSTPNGVTIELEYGGVTLQKACQTGNLPVMALLLMADQDGNGCSRVIDRASVLHWAAYYGQPALIAFLISRGLDVNSTDSDGGILMAPSGNPISNAKQTPLMCAAVGKHMQAVCQLLQLGADINARDAGGYSACFYAVSSPLVLHLLRTRGADIYQRADDGGTLLHWAAANHHYLTVLYLLEKGDWPDVNILDHCKRSPLHCAASSGGNCDAIRLLVANGADLSLKEESGLTAADLAADRATQSLLRSLESEVSQLPQSELRQSPLVKPAVQLAEVPSGWAAWYRFLFAFITPNAVLAFASMLPGILGFPFLAGAVYILVIITQRVASQDTRDLATTGWYMGALASGSCIMIFKVWPTVLLGNTQVALAAVWAIVTACMVACYLRVFLGDPGIVQSSAEQRQALYALAAAGQQPDQALYCADLLVKKPNRSKYCRNTHRCIARFDHYCVWLGNSIGAKNHRYFVLFCLTQFISQLFVFYWTALYLIAFKPTELNSLCSFVDLLFGDAHSLVTFFLVGYNLLAFIFVTCVLAVQIRYIHRNLTTNEVWFSQRYPWLIHLGNQVVSLYDAGAVVNWKEFWYGRMHDNEFTPPPINAHVSAKISRYQQWLQRTGRSVPSPVYHQPAMPTSGHQCCQHHTADAHRTCSHHANHQQACHSGHGAQPCPPQGSGSQPNTVPLSADQVEEMKAIANKMMQARSTAGGPPEAASGEGNNALKFQTLQQQYMAYFATLSPEQQQLLMAQSLERVARMRVEHNSVENPPPAGSGDGAERKKE